MFPFIFFLLIHAAGSAPRLPAAGPHGLPQIREVMPTTTNVHENLLRFSIRFAHPAGDNIVNHLSLVRADGVSIDEPFLKQELWSPDGKTLTILFGPGRVKTGLVAHDTLGRPLHAGENVTLELYGTPLVRWSVMPEWIQPINPKDWIILRPAKETRGPLSLKFPHPIDGMDADLILVVRNGQPVKGKAALNGTQSLWSFRPMDRWLPGRYTVLVHPHLEDPYGNEVGSAFETPEAHSAHSECAPAILPFGLR